jgi:hypothetical protein
MKRIFTLLLIFWAGAVDAHPSAWPPSVPALRSGEAILGGACICDHGCNFAGFYGYGLDDVNHTADHTFHVECVNAVRTCNYPYYGFFFKSGTIFMVDTTTGPIPPSGAAYPLFICL